MGAMGTVFKIAFCFSLLPFWNSASFASGEDNFAWKLLLGKKVADIQSSLGNAAKCTTPVQQRYILSSLTDHPRIKAISDLSKPTDGGQLLYEGLLSTAIAVSSCSFSDQGPFATFWLHHNNVFAIQIRFPVCDLGRCEDNEISENKNDTKFERSMRSKLVLALSWVVDETATTTDKLAQEYISDHSWEEYSNASFSAQRECLSNIANSAQWQCLWADLNEPNIANRFFAIRSRPAWFTSSRQKFKLVLHRIFDESLQSAAFSDFLSEVIATQKKFLEEDSERELQERRSDSKINSLQ